MTTKFGNHVTPEGGREIRNDAEYIRQSVAESFEKLQTDYIDLLYWYVLPKKNSRKTELVLMRIGIVIDSLEQFQSRQLSLL